MSEELKLSPKEGEKFMECMERAEAISDSHDQSVLFRFDEIGYVWHIGTPRSINQKTLITDYVERMVKRCCRDELNTLYKNATEEQRTEATTRVWARIQGQQLLPDDVIQAYAPAQKTKPLWQDHPNVAKPSLTVPDINWRDVIDIQSVVTGTPRKDDDYRSFSAEQTQAIEHCLDEMTQNIPEFRLLIHALNDPIIRFDLSGNPRPKLRICVSDSKNDYKFSEHVVRLATHAISDQFVDELGNHHNLILQRLLAHEIFHAADPLVVQKHSTSNRGTTYRETEDTGAVAMERIVNNYYGLETRKDYESTTILRKQIGYFEEDQANWNIGTLDTSVKLPLTFFGGENRALIHKKLHEILKISQEEDYIAPSPGLYLFDSPRLTVRKEHAASRG